MRPAWLGVLIVTACAHAPKGGLGTTDWLPEVRDRLDAVKGPGVATFDWDNTVMKHDIGDATLWWMLRNDKIKQPPARDWKQSSRWLSDAARAALNAACDAAAEPGEPMRTSATPACADAIYVIADTGKTPAGEQAWTEDVTRTMKASYLWTAQLLAGWKMDDARDFARAAFVEAALAPIGTTQTIGSHAGVPGWVRVYPQMQELIASLRQRGLDVWIVSASPQAFAEAMAESVGLPPNRAIGVRPLLDDYQRITAHVPGCGPAPDGEDALMTYNEGKRCWINKLIFKVPPAQQLTRLSPDQRPVFAAGDSDTDVAFLQDATLKLVIDRHRPEVMCNALNNHGDSWLIQPMFLEPMPPPAEKYACSAYLDETGKPMADR